MTKNSQFKLWWTAAVTVLLSTGCLYQNQVLPYLDKQAESLLICNHSENNRNWHQIKTDLISQTKPQSASDRKLKRLLDYLDTAFQASGLADCQKWGVSSTIKGNCFENRIILIPGNDPQGLLWHIWNGNTDIKPYISTLPGSSSTAIALNLDPSRVSGDLTKLLQFDNLINTATIRSLLGEKLLQDLSGCSGVWLAAAGDSSGEISLPDPDNKVFQELIRNFDPNEKKSATEYRTVIKNHQICYEICTEQYDFNGEPRLRISWHTEAYDVNQKLGSNPEFEKFSSTIPGKAAGFYWHAGTPKETHEINVLGKNVSVSNLDHTECGAIIQLPDGKILLHENSTADWVDQFSAVLLHAADLISSCIPTQALTAVESDEIAEDIEENPDESPIPEDLTEPYQVRVSFECIRQLNRIADGLKRYQSAYSGNLPEETGLTGWQKMLSLNFLSPTDLICPDSGCTAKDRQNISWQNTGYLYIGNWSGTKGRNTEYLPVVIDRPENHTDSFYVIYRNGKIELVKLTMPGSVLRMINKLHYRWQYPKEQYQELVRRAKLLDIALEQELEK